MPIHTQEIKSQILKMKSGENEAHNTIFGSLMASDLPPEELSVTRIQHEAAGIVGAGIETVKSTLALASFHILDNPDILRRLREELTLAIPNPNSPPSLPELEGLPYLTAVIEEGELPDCGV